MFRSTARRTMGGMGANVFENVFGSEHYEKIDPMVVQPPSVAPVKSNTEYSPPPMYNKRRIKAPSTGPAGSQVPDMPNPGQLIGTDEHVAEALLHGRPLKQKVSIEYFPPGWLALTPELQAKAELGFGLHDDERLKQKQAKLTKKKERARVYVDPGASGAQTVDGAMDGAKPVESRSTTSARPKAEIRLDSSQMDLGTSPAAASSSSAAAPAPSSPPQQKVGKASMESARFHDAHQPFSAISPLSPDLPEHIRSAAASLDEEGSPLPAVDTSMSADERSAIDNATHAIKTFEMGDYGGMYHWFGSVMGAAKELHVTPRVDMFFTEVTLTFPLTEAGRRLALYANLQEYEKASRRNFSDGLGGGELGEAAVGIPSHVLRRIEDRADTTFCWVLKQDKVQRDIFMSEIFLQWFHRADYLMRRKGKEKKEYRENMTLEQVLKSASQNRRRRTMKREEREKLREEARKAPSPPMVRAAAKRAMMEANSKKPIGRSVNKGMAVPRHHVNSIVETKRAKGKETVPRVSNRIIGNKSEGGSAGDWIDLNIDEDDDNYEEDPETAAAAEASQDRLSFAARFARQKELKRKQQADGSSSGGGGLPSDSEGKPMKPSSHAVVEVMPREMREEVDKDLDYDDGMQDMKTIRGTPKRFSNRSGSTWY
jgi:hypothetical protein